MSSPRFEDHRGVIADLITGGLDAVTEIRTVKDAVRGNHVHLRTTQWTYVVSGALLVVTARYSDLSDRAERVYYSGELACERPGIAHAWRAVTDCTVLVFTRGPRSGGDYELDTTRLDVKRRLI